MAGIDALGIALRPTTSGVVPPPIVMPAKVGTHVFPSMGLRKMWIPAFAGMTMSGEADTRRIRAAHP